MKTLHFYVGRDLLKTFALTLIALTILVTMGGGIANVFKAQGIDAVRIFKIFLLLVPVAVTLVLPVAALFSATITFGRAAADNELNACRAAGIDVHRLLLTPFLLSLAVAGAMYVSWNYVIPGLTGRIYEYTRQDLTTLLLANLRRSSGVRFGNRVIYADQCRELTAAELPAGTPRSRQYIALGGVAFMEMDGPRPLRLGTTESALVEFDFAGLQSDGFLGGGAAAAGAISPTARIRLDAVRSFDLGRSQFLEIATQTLGPFDIPLPLAAKSRFADLGLLRRYSQAPEELPELRDRISWFRRRLLRVLTYQWIVRQLDQDQGGTGQFVLSAADHRVEVTAERYQTIDEEGLPLLGGVTIVEEAIEGGQTVRHRMLAGGATIRVRELVENGDPLVQIELTDGVSIYLDPQPPGEDPVRKPNERLRPLPVPAEPVARLERYSDRDLLKPDLDLRLSSKLSDERNRLVERRDKVLAEVRGNIQFRASYAAGTIGVVLLGAILGAVLRGGQVLTAFGISCIPSLVVVIGAIAGRNFADQPRTHLVGVSLMWGFNVLLAIAAVFVCARYFRR